ncbi:hypothetical protein LB507_004197 [Fusarium sp. FIESC RH6]|nr:hypothetical protein LB507_004197 [Fusarium sp. FIESC RH6]
MEKPSAIVFTRDKISQKALDSFPDTKHGNVVWQTLLSNLNTTANPMCVGIATCPSNGSLALHQHTQPELYYVLGGSGQVEIDGVRHDVAEGSVLWIPGDALHGVFCGPEETLKWLYVFPEGRFEDVKYRFQVT